MTATVTALVIVVIATPVTIWLVATERLVPTTFCGLPLRDANGSEQGGDADAGGRSELDEGGADGPSSTIACGQREVGADASADERASEGPHRVAFGVGSASPQGSFGQDREDEHGRHLGIEGALVGTHDGSVGPAGGDRR